MDQCYKNHRDLPIPHMLYECCDKCNYNKHVCPGCGKDTTHDVEVCLKCRNQE